MLLKQIWALFKSVFRSWSDDHAQSMGAALAYYTLFSIAPLLLIVIAISGIVFGPQAARGEILDQLDSLMGEQGARAVQTLLESTSQPTEGLAATTIGFVLLLVGATTVFGELQNSLDRIWRVSDTGSSRGLWGLIRTRLLSFGMIMGTGFLLMVSLIFSAGLAAINKWWSPMFADWIPIASMVNFLFGFVLTTGMFAMIYKVMPRATIRWREVWTGAAITAALFTMGKWLIGIYIGRSAITSGYGAAGSLLALLVWIYYSAQIFLLGAEFTWAYSHFFGSRQGKDMPLSLIGRMSEAETLTARLSVKRSAGRAGRKRRK